MTVIEGLPDLDDPPRDDPLVAHEVFHLVVPVRDEHVEPVPLGLEEEPGVVDGVPEGVHMPEPREEVLPVGRMEAEVDLNRLHGAD